MLYLGHMTTQGKMLVAAILAIAALGGLYSYSLRGRVISTDKILVPNVQENHATTTPSATSTPTGGTSPNPSGTVESGSSSGQACAAQGGTWSSQHKECTGVSQNSCQELGGTWNDCASACRHDPNAQACIMMCVQVCTLP
jgi:hypothetical protein